MSIYFIYVHYYCRCVAVLFNCLQRFEWAKKHHPTTLLNTNFIPYYYLKLDDCRYKAYLQLSNYYEDGTIFIMG